MTEKNTHGTMLIVSINKLIQFYNLYIIQSIKILFIKMLAKFEFLIFILLYQT